MLLHVWMLQCYDQDILPPLLFIRSNFLNLFVPLYKTQSILSHALIIFRLKLPLIKQERGYISMHLEERETLMTMVFLEKYINLG